MMMPRGFASRIEFFVHGLPVPQGSKKVFRGNIVDVAKADLRDWRQAIAKECKAEMNGASPLIGPVSVIARFFLTRPKGHYGTGKNAFTVKDSAPIAPKVRPDIDKLARSVLDALTGVAFRDDGQVARLMVEKLWADDEHPGMGCQIEEIR